MSFGGDTKSRRSLLSGVYARGSNRSHQSALEMCNLSWTPHSSPEKDNSLNDSCVSPKMGCLEYTKELRTLSEDYCYYLLIVHQMVPLYIRLPTNSRLLLCFVLFSKAVQHFSQCVYMYKPPVWYIMTYYTVCP